MQTYNVLTLLTYIAYKGSGFTMVLYMSLPATEMVELFRTLITGVLRLADMFSHMLVQR